MRQYILNPTFPKPYSMDLLEFDKKKVRNLNKIAIFCGLMAQ